MSHQATITVNPPNDDNAGEYQAVIRCTCGETQHLYNADADEAEDLAWDHLVAHVGHDPRETPTGFENTNPA